MYRAPKDDENKTDPNKHKVNIFSFSLLNEIGRHNLGNFVVINWTKDNLTMSLTSNWMGCESSIFFFADCVIFNTSKGIELGKQVMNYVKQNHHF